MTDERTMDEAAPDAVLATFRKSIDNIDAALIHILAERFRITQAVGEYKAKVTWVRVFSSPRPVSPTSSSARSNVCARWRRKRTSIRSSRRSSCAS